MKPINIADVLRFVHQETGFLKHFEHVRQVQSGQSDHLNDLLAAVIGNGTYYGLHGMASISDRSYEHLRTVQANYLRPETLNLGNDATALLSLQHPGRIDPCQCRWTKIRVPIRDF